MSSGPLHGDRAPVAAPPQFAAGGSPTEQLVSGAVGERCVSCGAPLSSDQRYCVNCGERRGAARFTAPAAAAATAAPEPSRPRPTKRSRGPRSSAATLIAGLATLLLAMGVGILIGYDANKGNKSSAQNVTVTYSGNAPGAAASGAAASTTTSSASTAATGSTKHHRSGRGKTASGGASKANKPAKGSAPAPGAANKVLGGNGSNLPPATVTVGQTGHGPGYDKKGHFNGSFFGQ